jgi:hypothetical protein
MFTQHPDITQDIISYYQPGKQEPEWFNRGLGEEGHTHSDIKTTLKQ